MCLRDSGHRGLATGSCQLTKIASLSTAPVVTARCVTSRDRGVCLTPPRFHNGRFKGQARIREDAKGVGATTAPFKATICLVTTRVRRNNVFKRRTPHFLIERLCGLLHQIDPVGFFISRFAPRLVSPLRSNGCVVGQVPSRSAARRYQSEHRKQSVFDRKRKSHSESLSSVRNIRGIKLCAKCVMRRPPHPRKKAMSDITGRVQAQPENNLRSSLSNPSPNSKDSAPSRQVFKVPSPRGGADAVPALGPKHLTLWSHHPRNPATIPNCLCSNPPRFPRSTPVRGKDPRPAPA
jgi:hypothetical protein